MYQFIEMKFLPKKAVTIPTAQVSPTALHEVVEEESLNAVNPEVVEFLAMIATSLELLKLLKL